MIQLKTLKEKSSQNNYSNDNYNLLQSSLDDTIYYIFSFFSRTLPACLDIIVIPALIKAKTVKPNVPIYSSCKKPSTSSLYLAAFAYVGESVQDPAKYYNNKVGNCKYSDITVFSFHPVKIITTAEGGAALTNNVKLSEKLKLFRRRGRNMQRATIKPASLDIIA